MSLHGGLMRMVCQTTPIGLYGVTRRFAMGAERWDYYHALHLEKSKGSYNPCYCDECRIKKGVDK